MGIIVTKQDEKDKLTERINADLRTRVQNTSDPVDKDFVNGSDYLDETKKSGKFSWVWLILIFLAVASLVFIIIL